MKRSVILFLLLSICIHFYGQDNISNYYFQYPFLQDSKEWFKYDTPAERIAALQIPENKLNEIPTSALLDICMDFPYLIDFFLYNSYQQGYNALIHEFNGFKELSTRNDLAKNLADHGVGSGEHFLR